MSAMHVLQPATRRRDRSIRTPRQAIEALAKLLPSEASLEVQRRDGFIAQLPPHRGAGRRELGRVARDWVVKVFHPHIGYGHVMPKLSYGATAAEAIDAAIARYRRFIAKQQRPARRLAA